MNERMVAAIMAALEAARRDINDSKAGARERMLALSHQLTAALETPSEMILNVGWAESARLATMRTAVDLKLFEKLQEAADTSVSIEKLAAATGADATLLARVMKHLSAMNVVAETDVDTYRSTPLSDALTEPRYRDGIIYVHDALGPAFNAIPAFLKKTNYQNPSNLVDGPFQHAHSTDKAFFVWLAERPEMAACFNNYMSGYRQGKASWMDERFYPVRERLGQELTSKDGSDSVLLVDVGGGLGHDLKDFQTKHSDLSGRLILQDQPSVIAQIEPETAKGIDLTAHDFFTEQPVKGARAYFLHSVLHDWDDASCVKILKNLIPAMQPNYSKLLIHDFVIPDIGAARSATATDFVLMAAGSMKERTEKQRRDVLAEAGFKAVEIWTYENGTESLIEAGLPE